MINTGEFILVAAAFIYLAAAITGILINKKPFTRKLTNILLIASAILITLDMLLLIYYQVHHDFRFVYVYEHTSFDLAPAYLVSALWSGQEGSFLLWAVINSWIGLALWKALNKYKIEYKLVFTCFEVINICIIMMALISQPFKLMTYVPAEGLGLNLALQDPWMAVHPPLVFIGYSSMAVLFSLGLGTDFKIEKHWEITILRRWALQGWLFLGMGIFTGSLWAYRALGWGGYWAWDPIENAALIPWLLLTGAAHGGHTASKAGNRVKYMLPFVMAAFGTFLARSGILKDKSVHAYTGSSFSIPLFIFLAMLVLAILYFGLSTVKRKGTFRKHGTVSLLSILNVILYVFAALIFLGTIFPLISGTEVTTVFFNYPALFFSIALVILFIAECYAGFKEAFFKVLFVSAVITAVICLSMKFTSLIWLIVLWILLIPLVLWVFNTAGMKPTLHFKKIKNPFAAASHAGVILLILGAVASTALSRQGAVLIKAGSCTYLGYGAQIDSSCLHLNRSTIIHTIGSDIILSPAGNESSSAEQAVYYTTRPLIWLFWIGGALIILGILGALFKKIS
ncbi:MAG: cytochrome c biogenesis protein CcsA [Bacillota bacterium]|nr:cytochrome c biogenesis protein CcsA [Bacillota bacterium]